jgi:hypothetical protein
VTPTAKVGEARPETALVSFPLWSSFHGNNIAPPIHTVWAERPTSGIRQAQVVVLILLGLSFPTCWETY